MCPSLHLLKSNESNNFKVTMDRERLDAHDPMPDDIRAYLEKNGWSFSKRMCEFAAARMKGRDGKKIEPFTKEQVDKLLKAHEVVLEHDNGYDSVYIANMAKADFWGSSILDERQLARVIKDCIDDHDAYAGQPFTRYFADLIGAGVNVPWEELL